MNTEIFIDDINNILNNCWENYVEKKEVIKSSNGSTYALKKFKQLSKSHTFKRKMKQPESRFFKKKNNITMTKFNSINDFFNAYDKNKEENKKDNKKVNKK
tara:strand:- start:748 stop:1050 length:303 start_codon:yes stop_codon:yes gene_type:complete